MASPRAVGSPPINILEEWTPGVRATREETDDAKCYRFVWDGPSITTQDGFLFLFFFKDFI